LANYRVAQSDAIIRQGLFVKSPPFVTHMNAG